MVPLVTHDLAKSTENGVSAWAQRLQTQEAIVYDLQVLKQRETPDVSAMHGLEKSCRRGLSRKDRARDLS